ncbi:MAG TPA: hypothetical protein VNS88_12210, partial [Nitrospiraceae bacterium]|nr:hypothetical protein [Nitrospiraceae bacterium]
RPAGHRMRTHPVSADASTLQVSSPDFSICRGRNSELVRTLTPALLSDPATILVAGDDPMAIEMPKSGIDAVRDMVSWGGHFCLFL